MRGEADQTASASNSGHGLTAPVRIVRIRGSERAEAEDTVVRECTAAIVIGGRRLLRLQCLPEAVEDLALGLLVSAGLLPPDSPVPPIAWAPEEGEVRVDLPLPQERAEALLANLTLGSGCGTAMSPVKGYDPLDCWRKVDTSFGVPAATVSAAMRAFLHRSEVYVETGGVHAAAIARGADILVFSEDIGRHNAFDKAIGAARRQGIGLEDKLALVTGRLSLELVAKAVPASIPVLASRGAPTDAAVKLAAEANLTLIGFARAERMNVYTADWRMR